MSYDELVHFWKVAESNYIWIKILDIFTDCYGVQIKLDYTVFLRHERLKRSPQRFAHIGIQVCRLRINTFCCELVNLFHQLI